MTSAVERSNSCAATGRGRGFTLVEVLIVVSIIALLTGMLVPVLRGVRQAGQRTMCMANLHQIGVGASLYALDNYRLLPTYYCRSRNSTPFDTFSMRRSNTGRTLVNLGLLAEYVQNPETFYCPTQDESTSPTISFHDQQGNWQPELSAVDVNSARRILLPQVDANSSYPARFQEAGSGAPRWSMLNYTNKVIYSDFIGVNKQASFGRFDGGLRAPHDSKAYTRLFGDGSASWVAPDKIHPNDDLTANNPATGQLRQYYVRLDVTR